jgi:hypothetical protein
MLVEINEVQNSYITKSADLLHITYNPFSVYIYRAFNNVLRDYKYL